MTSGLYSYDDYAEDEFNPVTGAGVTKPFLEPPPPTTEPTSAYSSMYFETPRPDTAMDKMDDHIEVFELTFPPNETSDIEVEMVRKYDNKILKDFYVGDSTRRPNSYFYNELQDGEMKESVTHLQTETTPGPAHKDPLPTYKTYTDHYPSSTPAPLSSTSSPRTTTATTTTTTAATTTYFPSSEPSRRPPFTTFPPYFQQGGGSADTVRLGSLATTPALKFTTASYDPHTYGGAAEEPQQMDRRQDTAGPVSSVYQQLGPAINVTSPSEKSWERVVTLKPELDRSPAPAGALSTTQRPAPVTVFSDAPELGSSTTTRTPNIFVTSPTAWAVEDDLMLNTKKTVTQPDFSIMTEDVKETSNRRKSSIRTTMKPGFFDKPSKTKFSYNSGIKWGAPGKDAALDPIKLSIKRNQNFNKSSGKRRRNPLRNKNKFRRKSTLPPFQNIIEKEVTNEAPDDDGDDMTKSGHRPKLPALQFTTTAAPSADTTKPAKFDISKTLSKILERSPVITTIKPRQFVTNNVWTATKRPPPEGITTPGWHFHQNADLRTKRKLQRSEDGDTKRPAEDAGDKLARAESKIDQLRMKLKGPMAKSKKFVNRKLRPQLSRRVSSSRPKMIRFTAEDAMEPQRAAVTPADSSSFMSIARPRPRARAPHRLSRQREILIPEKAARRVDLDHSAEGGGGSPSYQITPNLRSGGYKISPVLSHPQHRQQQQQQQGAGRRFRPYQAQDRRSAAPGTWLLRSPAGKEFRFKSLHQIYDLNQNNFVPG